MKRKLSYAILICLSLLLVSSFVVYAAFVMTHNYEADIDYGEVQVSGNNGLTADVKDISFTTVGKKIPVIYTINNTSNKKPCNYYFTLNYEYINQNVDLSKMIFVYLNDELQGTLYECYNVNLVPTNDIVLGGLTDTATISFELHNGSANLPISDNNISITVNCYYQTPNFQKYIFVSNEEEFIKAIDDCNREAGKIIVLTNDIQLSGNISIEKEATIDLFGFDLVLDGTIVVESKEEYTVTIKDSKGNGSITGENKIKINSANALVLPMIDLSNVIHIEEEKFEYSEDLLYSIIYDRVLNTQYIINGLEYDFAEYLSVYKPAITLEGFTLNDNNIAVVESNSIASITVSTYDTYELPVYRSDTSTVLNSILSDELKHLEYIQTTNKEVTYNLYLPTSIKQYNATISWWSSKLDVLSHDGIIQNTQGMVELIATIKVNNEMFTRVYNLNIVKQDNLMKLQMLVSRIGMIEIDAVGETATIDGQTVDITKTLPTLVGELPQVADNLTEEEKEEIYKQYYRYYTEKNVSLGIESIRYELEPQYYYLTLKSVDNRTGLYLNQITFQQYARVKIYARFNGENEEETSFINVKISITQDDLLTRKVFDYVQTQLDKVNVLENILRTRKDEGIANESGNFTLPSTFMNVSIEYSPYTLGHECASIVSGVSSELNADNEYEILLNLNDLFLVERKVPINVSIMVDGTEVDREVLYFNVPAAITVDNWGFTSENMDLFYTLQLQTLEQCETPYLTVSAKDGEYEYTYLKDLEDSSGYTTFTSLGHNYILMKDIEKTTELYFELGNNLGSAKDKVILDKYELTGFNTLIKWARYDENIDNGYKEPTKEEIASIVNKNISWIDNDNTQELSDGEIALILKYCEKYPTFEANWRNCIKVGDNILTDFEIASLMETIVNSGFTSLLDWATGTSVEPANSVTSAGLTADDYVSTNSSNGETKISDLEEEVILYYVKNKMSNVYAGFIDVWYQTITRTDNVYLNDNNDDQPYSEVPEFTTDPIFADILTWANATTSLNLKDILDAKYGSGTTAKLFGEKGEKVKQYIYNGTATTFTISFESAFKTDLTSKSHNQTALHEWAIIQYYGITIYNITDTTNVFYSSYNGNENVSNVSSSTYLFLVGTHYYLTSTFQQQLSKVINDYYSKNGSTLTDVLEWATSTGYLKTKVSLTNNTLEIDSQSINLNVRYSDASSCISFMEYQIIDRYYDENILVGTTAVKEIFKEYFIISKLNLTMVGEELTNKIDILNSVSGGLLEGFNALIMEFTTLKNHNPKDCTESNCCSIVVGNNTLDLTNVTDGVETISITEYQYLCDYFQTNTKFSQLLQGTNDETGYINILVEGDAEYDRTIDNEDKEKLIEIINTVLDIDTNDKYKYIPIGVLDSNDLKILECLIYYLNLSELSVKGNSINSISDESNVLFEIVSRSNLNLQKITFNYCDLSDISTIINLTKLTFIDLRGNEGLTTIAPILEIDKGQIQYVNIYDTGIEFKYTKPNLIKMYVRYINNEKNDDQPQYLYDLNGSETLFRLEDESISENTFPALDACYLLNEITIIKGDYLQLPRFVYHIPEDESELTIVVDCKIKWSIESGRLTYVDSNKDGIIQDTDDYSEKYIMQYYGGDAVISATITVNGYSYKRYFEIIHE